MAPPPLAVNCPDKSFLTKLLGHGRLRRRSNEAVKEELEIIHIPDRSTRMIRPMEAPTEEECGNEIAMWRRALAKGDHRICLGTNWYTGTEMVGQCSSWHPWWETEGDMKTCKTQI